jgi:hypothetical protein
MTMTGVRTIVLAGTVLALLLSACGGSSPTVSVGTAIPQFDLDYDVLELPLSAVREGDRDAVADTVQLIRKGEHSLALDRLSALTANNPENSGLRILASYALLQTGNLVGAFEEAEKGHQAPQRFGYKCWFLGKVALLNGDRHTCEREIAHVHGVGGMEAEARELEQELAKR